LFNFRLEVFYNPPDSYYMTRKHFEALAAAIKRNVDVVNQDFTEFDHGRLDGIRRSAEVVADVCEASNPKFNRAKFIKACGL
jgi:hypothetical protein